MTCAQCGATNPEGNRFCFRCGKELAIAPNADSAPTAAPPSTSYFPPQRGWGVESRRLTTAVGELVRGFVGLVLIPVFVNVVQGMPELSGQRLGDFAGPTLVRAAGALLSVIVVAIMWSPAGVVFGQVILRLYRGRVNEKSARAATEAGTGLASLALIFGVYAVAVSPLREFVSSIRGLDWLPTATVIALLAATLVVLIQLYQSIGPVIEGLASREVTGGEGG